MRRLIATVSVLAVLGALAAAGATGATVKNVNVEDDVFTRAGKLNPTVVIRKQDKVRWTWRGINEHNVRVRIGTKNYRSPVQATGTYAKRFTRAGRFGVICEIHPNTMRMHVRVR